MQTKGIVEKKEAVGRGPTVITLAGGMKLQSFDHEELFSIQKGMFIEVEYDVEERPNNKGGVFKNNVISQWDEVEEPTEEQKAILNTPLEEKPDWDAKDRAIAMEAAYRSAAIFLASKPGSADYEQDVKELARVARGIYSDIQKARMGVAFVKAE